MGVFNQRSKIKAPAPTIRVEKVAVEPRPKPKPRPLANALRKSTTGSENRAKKKSASPHPTPPSSLSTDGSSRKRKLLRGTRDSSSTATGRSPASEVKFDSDDSESDDGGAWAETVGARKRRRHDADARGRRVDADRRLRHPQLWTGQPEEEVEPLSIIHAADVASLAHQCEPALGIAPEDVALGLRYPGALDKERYELVYGKDKIDAVRDVVKVVNFVAYSYLGGEDAEPFTDPTTGLCRQLERASSKSVWDGAAFAAAVDGYNARLRDLQARGAVAATLDGLHHLPRDLVAFVLEQVYDRTVAPKVELLAKYENGSDNVYGELLHPFVSSLLVERADMTSGQVFVDLGSGVGNVVLQAALEIGCESWGCEMMQNACDLAEAQEREFQERCKLWGVAPGRVHLERGDFRTNDRIHDALKRADVVLVNNQAFTSQLNDNLVSMFLDLKSGCKIISLKSFVHEHKSASNDVATSILQVEKHTYPEGYVSWTGAAGTFCISTRR